MCRFVIRHVLRRTFPIGTFMGKALLTTSLMRGSLWIPLSWDCGTQMINIKSSHSLVPLNWHRWIGTEPLDTHPTVTRYWIFFKKMIHSKTNKLDCYGWRCWVDLLGLILCGLLGIIDIYFIPTPLMLDTHPSWPYKVTPLISSSH